MRSQYLEAGTGPPVLLLHGHEQNATSWRWVIPALARTRRVLALSMPGHGETDPAVGGYAPGRDLVPFVAGFLSAIGVGSLDIVGNSVGGAGRHPPATAMARALFDLTGRREILLGQLHTLTLPTLVIWGENDCVLPAHHARAAVDRLRNGRLVLIPDCGHLPHVEHPDRSPPSSATGSLNTTTLPCPHQPLRVVGISRTGRMVSGGADAGADTPRPDTWVTAGSQVMDGN